MKITEEIIEPRGFLTKEYRQIRFKEIKKADFPELLFSLYNLFNSPRRHSCRFWVYVGPVDCYFNTRKELEQFMHGFSVSMELNDPSIRDKIRAFRESHPNHEFIR